ncbi:MAG: TM1266 family iron-only hydrogenase system putative regulator [Candidatus Borkfalkiaceae bacterium]|nr:TM1266 family iron-only hydrogenase system putative regulator [Christensenellaceae bacterium]
MKIGVIGIIIEGERKISAAVNAVLAEYGDIIIGRMGIPNLAENVYVISVAVKAPNEKISALTGRIGRLGGVKAKAAVTDASV